MKIETEKRSNSANFVFDRLVQLIRTLRMPGGCPWDKEQTHESLKKYVHEEADEVIEAIEENDPVHLCEELGDLLMLIVFHAQIASEKGTFSLNDVINGIVTKLVERHPHVFKSKVDLSSEDVVQKWDDLKKEGKNQKSKISHRMNQFFDFSSPLNAAFFVQTEAGKVGFDFPDIASAIRKIHEEAQELDEISECGDSKALKEELGDLLFSVVNLARILKVDSDEALRASSKKFIDRFFYLEKAVQKSGGFNGKTVEELDSLWEKAKCKENSRKKNESK